MSENGNGAGTRTFIPPDYPEREKLDLVGSAEAAVILGVEKPRIGRFIKRGIMPEQAPNYEDNKLFGKDKNGKRIKPKDRRLASGPVWYREDIEMLAAERRRQVPKRTVSTAS